ncbi:hypothetical protein ACFL5P_04245, partial [candidate division KSB1 bacterium]
MKAIFKILSITKYEIKTIFRSWFFRIFFLTILSVLILLNLAFFVLPQTSRWLYYGIASGIPYMNFLLLNVAQAIIGIFLASDFLKNDAKLDTTDAIYTRSMTNITYVTGKVFGLLIVFGCLNLAVMGIGLIFNVFFLDLPVITEAYFLYPILISFPTLVFIIGMTIMLMSVLKNQAIAIILMFGYFVTSMFFLNQEFNFLFDYIALNLPLMYSDIVGFGDVTGILIHRGIYFFLGIAFIFMSSFMINRPLQSKTVYTFSTFVMAACLAIAVVGGGKYISDQVRGQDLRQDMYITNEIFLGEKNITPVSYNIQLEHIGTEINVSSGIKIQNNTSVSLDKYIFNLNPGLEVVDVRINENSLPFERDKHIVTVTPTIPLQSGLSDSIVIDYRGSINEEASYFYNDEDTRDEKLSFFVYNVDKRYSFIDENYVLLTVENMWYPAAGPFKYSSNRGLTERFFIDFLLDVKTSGNLTAISQGKMENPAAGEFKFKPERPLPQISLVIGEYEQKSVSVDDRDYTLFYIAGHDYFAQFFEGMEDLIADEIAVALENFEYTLGMAYPYKRLQLVETPIQFFTYPSLLTSVVQNVQPEQIFLPEKGVLLDNADFKNYTFFTEQRMRGGRGVTTPEDNKRNLFRRFVDNTFLAGDQRAGMMRGMERGGGGGRGGASAPIVSSQLVSVINFLRLSKSAEAGSYSIFPMFYSFIYNYYSDKWPLFNTAVEYYFLSSLGGQMPMRGMSTGYLSDQDRANLELSKSSLLDMIASPGQVDDLPNILEQKCSYLFLLFQTMIGKDEFDMFLIEFMNTRGYTDIDVEEFLSEIENNFEIDYRDFFDSWLLQDQLPAYSIGEVESYEIIHGEMTRYQVIFDIQNSADVSGLVNIEFRTSSRGLGGRFGGGGGRGGGMGGFGGTGSDNAISILLDANQSKRVGGILDNSPIGMSVNTLISQNMPSVLERSFSQVEFNESIEPFEGEVEFYEPIVLYDSDDIIVDNEDPGFSFYSYSNEGYLKKKFNVYYDDRMEYSQISTRNLPKNWEKSVSLDYFGDIKHTIHFIESGSSDNNATWKTEIDRAGEYDIYYYVSHTNLESGGRGGRGGMGRGGGEIRGGRRGGDADGAGGPSPEQRGGGGGRGDQGRGQAGQDQGRSFLDRFRRGMDSGSTIKDFNFRIHQNGNVREIKIDISNAEPGWNLIGTFLLSGGETSVELTGESEGRM